MNKMQAIDVLKCKTWILSEEKWQKAKKMAIEALEKQSEAEQFARWVATKIFSGMFEDDPVTFEELACRKLAKLGIVRANGNMWELVESQEREE